MFSIPWLSPRLPRLSRIAPSLAGAATRRARRWARKRQGTDPVSAVLTGRRTYILPTGVGLVYALMAFAMLLGSMNYNNNLSFVLTFFLIALGFVAMHACQRNLVGLEVNFAGVEPVFAGQPAHFRFAITNTARNPRSLIRLYAEDAVSEIEDLEPGETRMFILPVATDKRGRVALERFGLRSTFPFELFRSWAWLHMNIHGIAYPAPAKNAPSPPASLLALGHRQHDERGEEDFAGLRRFVTGDSPRNVAWKAYARNGQLLSKRFAGADTSSQWFDFDEADATDLEARLSILTRWIVNADRAGEDYGLRIPGFERAPAHGDTHRRQCLEALAMFELTTVESADE